MRGVPLLLFGTTKFRSMNPAQRRNPKAGQSIHVQIASQTALAMTLWLMSLWGRIGIFEIAPGKADLKTGQLFVFVDLAQPVFSIPLWRPRSKLPVPFVALFRFITDLFIADSACGSSRLGRLQDVGSLDILSTHLYVQNDR